ncbi:magnesium chelatase subunit H [Acetobacteraceae bacterium KSS8]|uniref:magnesium chelatase n=1 Tax=Endosaccharibacter trunci TaxID=2812733 RepID=A0ABT1W4Z0_9PROT|nr:magnesium chelatase subunit H [Acetobacteraceae bacterium KSS8]
MRGDGALPVTPVRVAIVTMDSHLSSAATRAEAMLRREMPGLELAVHAAAEWNSRPDALQDCLNDIARADIVVATMLFLDEHIRAVLPALKARRERCDAMVCIMAAGEVVKLTRLGRFDMSAESSGAMALLRKLRGNRGKSNGAPASGEKQMRMLRRLPQLLRFIPGTAQDARAYFLVMQYWLAGSDQNIAGMVRLLVGRYCTGARRPPVSFARVQPPVVHPDIGLYHPSLPRRMTESLSDLPQGSARRGTVGLLLLRSYVLAGNAGHYDGVIAALEARGLRVIPAFAAGLDQRPAIERFFTQDGVPVVDAILSLTGFSLVGGPAYNDSDAAAEILARLDVPYLAALPVEFQSLEEWERSAQGLGPVEAAMMVAIPELDGATGPLCFGGRSQKAESRHDMVVHAERAAMLAARVGKLVALRRTERKNRRVAIVLFNFPPNSGGVGTAAFLSVFQSLHNALQALVRAGYDVAPPEDVDALRRAIVEGNAGRYGTDANVAARVSADEHVRREPHLREIERCWGPAPGQQNSDGQTIQILGARFGNVFVGVQPAIGIEGDPMRLLFEGTFAPTHAFSAFYRYLREDFAADAVLHFGTHGALEFMPGKQCALSGACWPDRLIGDLPNLYLYACNNPSEGALAKRRAGATLISHLTPSLAQAGLYRGLLDLRASLDRWRVLPPDAPSEQHALLHTLIQAQAAAVEMAPAEPAWTDPEAELSRLVPALLELEQALIPHGLHVVGSPPDAGSRAALLEAMPATDPETRARIDALLAEDAELPAILHALDGGFVRPAPGGDLARTPAVLPTGRNLHGFDPFRIPSAFAVADGRQQADRLLARHAASGASLPETVAMVLWGTDNLKSEGSPLSQVLWLLGAAPRHDSYGRLCGATLRPLAELGRPRIDVLVTLSGIFRDLLPMQTRLIAEACLLAAEADEPVEQNYVRKHTLAFVERHGGTMEDAALRVFSNDDGAYGSNVNLLLDDGAWQDETELSEAFLRRKGFAYGATGTPRRHDVLLSHVLSAVDVAYQNLESVELGVTTLDHYFDTLGGVARAVRATRGDDAASVYIGDQTRGDGVVRTLAEQVALETRTRALNPKWFEALLEHGHEGVRHIEAHVTNTLGWSATTGQVAPWIYQSLSETYVLDDAMRERLAAANPTAALRIANRLIEAHERRYWSPDPSVIDRLRRAGEQIEDRLEGLPMEHAA